jgi:aldose 1-epimerase
MKIHLVVILALSFSASTFAKQNKIEQIPANNFKTEINGKQTALYTLTNSKGMTVQITNYGARVVALWVPDKVGGFQDVVWGFSSIQEYLKSTDIYCGPIVGRFGNRINKGQFKLKNTSYQLTINNNGNHLHGGTKGFECRVWDAKYVKVAGNKGLKLSYVSPDGEEGYPGNLTISVTYIVTENNELTINYSATTDAETIVNPTSHCYFNLSGTTANTILSHQLKINALKYTPVTTGLIPTGELLPVKGTPLDFTKFTTIGEHINVINEQLALGLGYDHNYVLNKKAKKMGEAAEIYSNQSGISMKVITDQPGLQFYSGNFMDGTLTGKRGDVHAYRTGFALEAQNYPDAPNHKNFPSAVLQPNETYSQTTTYAFSIKK